MDHSLVPDEDMHPPVDKFIHMHIVSMKLFSGEILQLCVEPRLEAVPLSEVVREYFQICGLKNCKE